MTTIVAITVITIVGVLFAAMAVAPMLIEASASKPARAGRPALVHSASVPPRTDQPRAA